MTHRTIVREKKSLTTDVPLERRSLMLSIALERPPDFNKTRGTEETSKKQNGCATGQQGVSNASYLKSSTGIPIVSSQKTP
jgi:hypothetical protein